MGLYLEQCNGHSHKREARAKRIVVKQETKKPETERNETNLTIFTIHLQKRIGRSKVIFDRPLTVYACAKSTSCLQQNVERPKSNRDLKSSAIMEPVSYLLVILL